MRFQPPEYVERAFSEFAQRIHSERPLDGGTKIDLHAHPLLLARGICGMHGRVIPSRQDLCPRCGGILELITETQMLARRRLWRELQAM